MAKNNNMTILVLVVIGFLLFQGGNLDLGAIGGRVADDTSGTITECLSSTTPAVTFNAKNMFTGATVTGNVRYKVNDDGIETVATGTAIAASPDDKIEYIVGAAGYHNVSAVFTVPCREVVKESVEIGQYDTALNVTYYKNENDDTNAGGAQQAIAAGGLVSVDTRYQATADRAGDYLAVFSFNNSQYDDVTAVGLEKGIVPSHFTVADTSFRAVAYELGELLDNQKLDFFVEIEADSVQNPETDITVDVFSASWYIDEEDGNSFKYGFEDENGNQVGDSTTIRSTIFLS